MKDLAQETSRSTWTIQERVNAIVSNVDSIMSTTEHVTDLMCEVSSTTSIASAVEEQTILMTHLSQAAESLSS